jgi:membrane peptidoglycan carboxypeptidase
VQQAALVAIDGEGRIRAYVGGADYADSQFDRATTARRQAGSAFKPFVYLTAMEQGRTPAVMVVDEPVKIGNWEPKNYTNKYLGPITLQTALAQSINTVAARLANEVGTSNVANTAAASASPKIQLDPSMALGAVEVSPMEMAQAYAPFSNGGFLAKGYGIERIRTASGKVLYDHGVEKQARSAVIGSPALQYMNQMMRTVVTSGTGTRAKVAGYDIAGKTGTTSDYKDAWFVGYTGGFVTAVWTGKDDNTPMKRVTGGGAPAEIWRTFMAAALPRLKATPIPGGVVEPRRSRTTDPIGDLINPTPTPEGPAAERKRPPSALLSPPPADQLLPLTERSRLGPDRVQLRRVRPQPCAVRRGIAGQLFAQRPELRARDWPRSGGRIRGRRHSRPPPPGPGSAASCSGSPPASAEVAGRHEPQRALGSATATVGIGRPSAAAWTAVRSVSTASASRLARRMTFSPQLASSGATMRSPSMRARPGPTSSR